VSANPQRFISITVAAAAAPAASPPPTSVVAAISYVRISSVHSAGSSLPYLLSCFSPFARRVASHSRHQSTSQHNHGSRCSHKSPILLSNTSHIALLTFANWRVSKSPDHKAPKLEHSDITAQHPGAQNHQHHAVNQYPEATRGSNISAWNRLHKCQHRCRWTVDRCSLGLDMFVNRTANGLSQCCKRDQKRR
jgi:hypothetical protein